MKDLPPQSRFSWPALSNTLGSSLIELALVLPVFFLMVFGFINFCMVALDMCTITYSSRIAARYIALHGPNTFGYTTSASAETTAQPMIDQLPIPYPQSTRSTQYVYCGPLTNTTGATYNCVKVTNNAAYTLNIPGYTFTGLQAKAFTEEIFVVPR